MKLPRFLPAAALSAGLALSASAQTPAEPPKDPPTTGAPTPAAPNADTKADFDKAIEALRAGKVDDAIKALAEACKKDNKLPPPLVILSSIAAQSNNGQAARQFLERASVEDHEHPDPYILSGQFALNEGRLMDATLCFEAALVKAGNARWLTEQRPRFIKSAREGLARAYSSRGQIKEALQQLQALLKDDPKNAMIRWQVARIIFAGDPDGALAELKTAYADDPDNPQIGLPETNMGRFWDSKPGKTDEETAQNKAKAEEWHKKALAAHPKHVMAPREYGHWLMNEGRMPEADAQLTAAKTLKADDNGTNALIGLAHRYKKQYDKAEEIFDGLNRQDRTNNFYAWNLALSMAESADEKKKQQAVTIAQLVQTSQPKNPEAMAILGWCLFKAGRYDDAERALSGSVQAASGQGTPPDTVYFLARMFDHRGKSTDARDALKKALDSKAAFVYRADAQKFFDELVAKHGPVKEEPKEPKKP